AMVERDSGYRKREKGEDLVDQWEESVKKFVKVIRKKYKQMLGSMEEEKGGGLSDEEGIMFGFEGKRKGG
uniref:hypothetical protein n=1 Tax=Bacillus subtilis TaxID=1423 RepID=UPI001BDB9B63